MMAGVLHGGGGRCPYGPCRATTEVRLYLRNPGDTVPTLPLIEPHRLDAEYALPGEMCSAGLMRMPLGNREREILARGRIAYLRRQERAQAEPKPPPASETETSGVGEHSLTPHPTENRQWFMTAPERRAGAMANAEDIKTRLGLANMAMAEAQQLAFQADDKVSEARQILSELIGATGVPLGIGHCTTASEKLMGVQADLHKGIEENSNYAEGL